MSPLLLTASLLLAAARPLSAEPAAPLLERLAADDAASSDELSLLQVTQGALRAASAKSGQRAGAASAWPGWVPQSPGGPQQNREVPELTVDFDAPPEKRWQNVTRYYKSIGAYPECCTLGGVGRDVLNMLHRLLPLPSDYLRELEGIVADVGHPNVTVETLSVMNLGYEMSGSLEWPLELFLKMASGQNSTAPPLEAQGCSGVLAAREDGTVIHGRNLDYAGLEINSNGAKLHWPDVSVEVLIVKGGRPFITSVQWPGLVGFVTAMRFGGWSFEQNTRFHGIGADILSGVTTHSQGFLLQSRTIMETTPDFETAVQRFSEAKWMAPQYFILAGPEPYQGAIVTVDRSGRHQPGTPPVLRLSSDTAVLGNENFGWHLVQTNDDHFKEPLDERRPDEELRLASASRGSVTEEWMWSEMLSSALYNNETVYTTVYVPKTGYHKTYVHAENWR